MTEAVVDAFEVVQIQQQQTHWKPALDTAGIGIRVRTHDLRHAHASWLLAGGADLQTIKERLGHGSMVTTQKYLHTLTALATIRARHRPK